MKSLFYRQLNLSEHFQRFSNKDQLKAFFHKLFAKYKEKRNLGDAVHIIFGSPDAFLIIKILLFFGVAFMMAGFLTSDGFVLLDGGIQGYVLESADQGDPDETWDAQIQSD